MNELAVLVPVLGRPHRVVPTLQGFTETAPARVLFIASPEDTAEIDALKAAGAEYIMPGGNYARKIRAGVERTSEPFVFTAADDLEALSGWYGEARQLLKEPVEVVGINDLLPRQRQHATHFLMARSYAEGSTIDGQPGPFFDGYWHWYCDDELIATARHRGVYAYARKARLKHLHPLGGGEDDATYERGRAQRKFDYKLFQKRMQRWM